MAAADRSKLEPTAKLVYLARECGRTSVKEIGAVVCIAILPSSAGCTQHLQPLEMRKWNRR